MSTHANREMPASKGRSSQRRSRRGVAAVEAAVMLALYVLLVLGTIETCSMIFLKQSLEIAAYEGARAAIVPRSNVSKVKFKSNEILGVRHVRDGAVTVTPADFDTLPYGTIIRVSATAPCNSNGLFPASIYGNRSLTGEAEMMKEY
jgi:hypothetical protein